MTYFNSQFPDLYYNSLDRLGPYNPKYSDPVTYNLATVKIIISFHLFSLLINYY
jgi:hypothetical protein